MSVVEFTAELDLKSNGMRCCDLKLRADRESLACFAYAPGSTRKHNTAMACAIASLSECQITEFQLQLGLAKFTVTENEAKRIAATFGVRIA